MPFVMQIRNRNGKYSEENHCKKKELSSNFLFTIFFIMYMQCAASDCASKLVDVFHDRLQWNG
jgi:hypothetical protein